MVDPVVTISDHAVLRFIERAMGIDVEDVRARLHSEALEVAHRMGCRSVKAHGGRIIVKEGVAVTYLGKEMRGEVFYGGLRDG